MFGIEIEPETSASDTAGTSLAGGQMMKSSTKYIQQTLR